MEHIPTHETEDQKDPEEKLEYDVARAHRMALAMVPYREAILEKTREKGPVWIEENDIGVDIATRRFKRRQKSWAEEEAAHAGMNHDIDMSEGESLVNDPNEAETMAYAARRGMEKALRYKRAGRTAETVIDKVTDIGFLGVPMTNAVLRWSASKYFNRKANKSRARADDDAEATRK